MSEPTSGQRPHNSLLAALPDAEYQRLAAHLKPVSLKRGEVMHEADTPAQYVYFLDEGVASLSVSTEDGKELMLSIVGHEGVVGERAIFKEGVFIIRCEMLTEGRGHRMPPAAFDEEFNRGERLHGLVLNRIEARTTETAQTALCNQMHSIDQRLARWLLTLADRLHSDELLLTHDHMANMWVCGTQGSRMPWGLCARRDASRPGAGRSRFSTAGRWKRKPASVTPSSKKPLRPSPLENTF